MNHLILEGVRGCRSLIVGLKEHITWQTAKNNRYHLHVIMCVIVKQYLAWGQKPNKNSHPCYWHTWFVHVQMFKALVEQPEYTAPNVKDRKVSVSVPNSEAHTEGHQAYRKSEKQSLTKHPSRLATRTTPLQCWASLSISPQELCTRLGRGFCHWCYSRHSPGSWRGRRRRSNGG